MIRDRYFRIGRPYDQVRLSPLIRPKGDEGVKGGGGFLHNVMFEFPYDHRPRPRI